MISVIHGLVNQETEEKLRSELDRATTIRQVLLVGNALKRTKMDDYPKWTITFTRRDLSKGPGASQRRAHCDRPDWNLQCAQGPGESG